MKTNPITQKIAIIGAAVLELVYYGVTNTTNLRIYFLQQTRYFFNSPEPKNSMRNTI